MSRLLYLAGKSLGNIGRRPLSAVTTLVSLLLLFIMLCLSWIAYLSGDKYFNSITKEINMELFFDDGIPDTTVTAIVEAVSRLEGVKYMVYVSKDNAREKLFTLMGADLLEGLETNPLPRSMILEFERNFLKSEKLRDMADNLMKINGVTEIYYPIHWLEKTEYSRSIVKKITLFLGITILMAVILNTLHAIRLSARGRHEELYQLQLLGGGKWFLSIPYVFESFFYMLMASVSGWLIISYAGNKLTFRNVEIVLPAQIDMIYFCILVSVIGMFIGFIGIRRSL